MRIKKIVEGLCIFSAVALMTATTKAAIIQLDLQGQAGSGLLSGNELGAINGTPGSGGEVGSGIQFDDVTKVLSIDVGWGSGNGFLDLSGNASAAHIHGPATQTQNAGVLINLSSGLNVDAVNGGIVFSSAPLSAGDETSLLGGLMYINVHTGLNPGGEIRGNIEVIPEPSSLALIGIAAGGIIFFRRSVKI